MVIEGEFTFRIGEAATTGGPGSCAFLPRNVPHAWKNRGGQPGRVVFLYTPAGAGRFVEDMVEQLDEGDLKKRLGEAGWEVLGPNPLQARISPTVVTLAYSPSSRASVS